MPSRRIRFIVAFALLSGCADDTPSSDGAATSTSSSTGAGSSTGEVASSSSSTSGLDDSTSSGGESSSSSGASSSSSTGEPTTCGNGVVDPGELCIGDAFTELTVGTSARDLLIEDIDKDGWLDLVSFDADTPSIYLTYGGSDGFGEPEMMEATAGAFALSGGDFDLDGDVDLVVFGEDMTLFQNDAGTLASSTINSAGSGSDQLGDGVLGSFDMLSGLDAVHTTSASVFFQQGTIVGDAWEFDSVYVVTLIDGATGIARRAFSFDGDELDDLVLLNRNNNRAEVFRATGTGMFESLNEFDVCPSGSGAYRGLIADVNGDDAEDLIVTCDTGVWSLLYGTGDGEFDDAIERDLETAFELAVADFNHDGLTDIAVTNSGQGQVEIYLNDGMEGMVHEQSLDGDGAAWSFKVADLNNDGAVDVVTALSTNGGAGNLAIFWAEP